MDEDRDKYIMRALDIAGLLDELAENGEEDSRDDSCRVFYGIVRDCAYKIRDRAIRERRSHERERISS